MRLNGDFYAESTREATNAGEQKKLCIPPRDIFLAGDVLPARSTERGPYESALTSLEATSTRQGGPRGCPLVAAKRRKLIN